MKKNNVVELKNPVFTDALTALLRQSARQVIAQAIEAELALFLSEVQEILSNGKPRVVRNGYLPEREILTGIGKVKVRVPRIRDRKQVDTQHQFQSALIPPYLRRTATLNEVLPLLYLKGISEVDFVEVLTPLFGEHAKNLSPGVISRLKSSWQEEYQHWQQRNLGGSPYVYWWVDGIGFSVRDEARRCVLVVMGVTPQGNKELIALYDGYRESTESWFSLLRDLKARGLTAPRLAVGDGALGFWHAMSEVFPSTRHQRCWFHKMGNVLDKWPKAQQSRAKGMLHEIWRSATRKEAYQALEKFKQEYGSKYPKAWTCLWHDREELLAFYDFPAEHWMHVRTTNPIESVFATVRQRTYKAKGAFSNQTVLTMAFKLMQSAQKRWIRLQGSELVERVFQGVIFVDGKEKKEPDAPAQNPLPNRTAA